MISADEQSLSSLFSHGAAALYFPAVNLSSVLPLKKEYFLPFHPTTPLPLKQVENVMRV